MTSLPPFWSKHAFFPPFTFFSRNSSKDLWSGCLLCDQVALNSERFYLPNENADPLFLFYLDIVQPIVSDDTHIYIMHVQRSRICDNQYCYLAVPTQTQCCNHSFKSPQSDYLNVWSQHRVSETIAKILNQYFTLTCKLEPCNRYSS